LLGEAPLITGTGFDTRHRPSRPGSVAHQLPIPWDRVDTSKSGDAA